jgi:2-polyprenyl-3-methyl-5-hydroxy-6-metoxy-1,4-benzoquinol methylase
MYQEVPCPLCGSSDRKLVYRATKPQVMTPADLACATALLATYDAIVKCRSCGLRYTSPRPSDGDIAGNYRDVEDTEFLQEHRGRELTYQRLIKEIDRILMGKRGKLLDVGCAMGFFPVEARKAGWEVEGLEPSIWAVEYARREFGLNVRQGNVAEAELAPESYDVITVWDVVEHMTDPVGDFRKLAGALKPGGLLAFATHSIESPAARIMGRRYPFLMSMHITHFSSWTTGLLCEKAGLTQVSITPHLRFIRMGYVVKKLEQVMPRLGGVIHRLVRALGLEDRCIVVSGLGLFNAFAIRK